MAESEVNHPLDYGRTHGHAVSSLAPIVNEDISNAEAKKKKKKNGKVKSQYSPGFELGTLELPLLYHRATTIGQPPTPSPVVSPKDRRTA